MECRADFGAKGPHRRTLMSYKSEPRKHIRSESEHSLTASDTRNTMLQMSCNFNLVNQQCWQCSSKGSEGLVRIGQLLKRVYHLRPQLRNLSIFEERAVTSAIHLGRLRKLHTLRFGRRRTCFNRS